MNKTRSDRAGRIIAAHMMAIFFCTLTPPPLLHAEPASSSSIPVPRAASETRVLDRVSARITPESGGILELGSLRMEIPSGAVDQQMDITVEKLARIPALNAGLENATAQAVGYRALPHGTRFSKPVKLSLPFDPTIAKGTSRHKNLAVYFFDDDTETWRKLQSIGVNESTSTIECVTDHFTDFISATLRLPESPEPLGYNPNSIKDIKAADPSACVPAPQGLEGLPGGDAAFQLKLRLPEGRAGLEPQIQLSYNSGHANGWLGQGFDLALPTIGIDTSKRLPRYDDTDAYIWSGRALTFAGVTTEGTLFRPRVEGDFATIIRIPVDDPVYGHRYKWEVREKNGRTSVFGGTPKSVCGKDAAHDYQWLLTRIEDQNGNYCSYSYSGESAGHLYPEAIEYTRSDTHADRGFYRIEFKNSATRSDRRLDMRGGFPDTLDKLLEGVVVRFYDPDTAQFSDVRSYEFRYQTSAFGKSCLTTFRELDAKGTVFYAYDFEYEKIEMQDGKMIGLAERTPWAGKGSESFTTNSFASGSLSLGADLYYPQFWKPLVGAYAGVNISGGTSDTYDNNTVLDINGDGLPDLVTGNMKGKSILLGRADGLYVKPSAEDIPSELWDWIESASSTQTNQDTGFFGALTFKKKPTASGAYSTSTGKSSSPWTWTDLDGDGKLDCANVPKPYYYRNESDALTVRFTKTNYGATDGISRAPAVPDSVLRENHLLDPLRMWVAYRSGDIRVDASVSATDTSDGWDGATVTAYAVRGVDEAVRTGNTLKLSPEVRAGSLDIPDQPVSRGDQLVFRQSSGLMTEGDEIVWNTSIRYRSIKLFTDLTNRPFVALPSVWPLFYGADSDMMRGYYTQAQDQSGYYYWQRKSTLPPLSPEISAYFAGKGFVVPEKMRLKDYYHFISIENRTNQASLEMTPEGPISDLWQRAYQYDPIEGVMVLTDFAKNPANMTRLHSLSTQLGTLDSYKPLAALMPADVLPSSIDRTSGLVVSRQNRTVVAGNDPSQPGFIDTDHLQTNARAFVEKITHLDGRTTDVYLRPFLDSSFKTHLEVVARGAINGIHLDTWIDGKTPLTLTSEKYSGVYRFKVTGDWQETDQARTYYLAYDPHESLDRESGMNHLFDAHFRSEISAQESTQVHQAMQDYVAAKHQQRFAAFQPGDEPYLLWLEALGGNPILTPKATSLTALFGASFDPGADGSRYTLKPEITDPGIRATILWAEVLSGAVTIAGSSARYTTDDYLVDFAGIPTAQSPSDFLAAHIDQSLNLSASRYFQTLTFLAQFKLKAQASDENYIDDSTDPEQPVVYSQTAVFEANPGLLKPLSDASIHTSTLTAIEYHKAMFRETISLTDRFQSLFNTDSQGNLALKENQSPADRRFAFWWELCAAIVTPDYLSADPILDAFVIEPGNETNPAALFLLPKQNLFTYLSVTESLYCDSEYTYTVRAVPATGTIHEYGFPAETVVRGTETDAIVLSRFDEASGTTIEAPVYVHAFDTTADTDATEMRDAIPVDYADLIGLPRNSILTNYSGGGHHWYYAEWKGYPADTDYSLARIRAQDAIFQEDTEEGIRNTREDERRDCQVIWKMARDETAFPGQWHGSVYTRQATHWDANAKKVQQTIIQSAALIGPTSVTSFRLGGDEAILSLPEVIEAGGNLSWIRKSTARNTTRNMSLLALPDLSWSRGTSEGTYDLTDVNGDRFPDMIKKTDSGLQVFLNKGETTDPDGSAGVPASFDTTPLVWGSGSIRSYDNSAISLSTSIIAGTSQVIRSRTTPGGRSAGSELDPATSSPSAKLSFADTESLTVGSSFQKSDLIDMNGDGLPDQVTRSGNDLSVRLNDGAGFSHSHYFAMSGAVTAAIARAVTDRYGSIPMNGEIRDALAGTKPGSIVGFSGNTSVAFGLKASLPIGLAGGLNLSASTDRSYFDLMDLNGDGLPDLLIREASQLKVCFNLGDSFADPVYWGSQSAAAIDLRNVEVYKADANASESLDVLRIDSGAHHDIESPLVLYEEISSSTTLGCAYNGSLTVGPEIPIFYWFTFLPPTSGKVTYTIRVGVTIGGGVSTSRIKYGYVDVNGDGLPDNVLETDSGMSVRVNRTGTDGLLKAIRLPQGGIIRLAYAQSDKTTDDPIGRLVLSEVIRENWTTESKPHAALPINVTRQVFEYRDGHFDRADRRFWGYAEVKTRRMTSAAGYDFATVSTDTYHNDSYYLKDRLKGRVIEDASGSVLFEQQNEYATRALSDRSVWVRSVRTTERFRDNGAYMERETAYTDYDDSGNPTEIKQLVNGRLRNTVRIDYHPPLQTGNHLLTGQPEYLRVYDQDNRLLRKRYGQYDNGNLICQRAYWADNDYDYLETNLTYDGYGNLTSLVDNSLYALEYRYDPVIATYVTNVSDTLGRETRWTYDYAKGSELSQTDVNGQTMHKDYDDSGRMIALWSPYDDENAALEFSYDTAAWPWKTLTKNKVNFEATDDQTVSTVIIADGFGEVLQTKKQILRTDPTDLSEKDGWSVSPWVIVDGLGRPVQQGQPGFDDAPANTGLFPGMIRSIFGEQELFSSTIYDSRDRIKKIVFPGKRDDGSRNKLIYDYALDYWQEQYVWKTTTTDPEGSTNQTLTDANELILAVIQDPEGEKITTTFVYDGIGQMKEAIDDGQKSRTVISYDILGRRIALDNPDIGLVTFAYDEKGDLVRKIDPVLRSRNLSIRYEYDQHRLMKEIYPDSTVSYEYGHDPDEFNVDRVIKTITPDVTTGTTYGRLGEVTSIRRQIKTRQPGQNDYDETMEYAHNYLGQLRRIGYPNGETVSYEYDAGGQVKAIRGRCLNRDVTYAARIGYDEFGQRVLLEQGNGTFTTYSYDPARRWLQGLKTVRKNDGEVLQSLSYAFYGNGNIRQFTDTARTKSFVQNYTYDRRDQLESARGSFQDTKSALVRTAAYTQFFDYDRLGNMLEKRSTGNRSPGKTVDIDLSYTHLYKYENEAKPHQASMIGDTHYVYDENGNVTKLVPDWEWSGASGPTHPTITVTNTGDGHDTGSSALGLRREMPANARDSGTRYLGWDSQNRLTSVSETNMSVRYYYDSDGERRLKVQGTEEQVYVDRMYEIDNSSSNPVATIHVYLGESRLVSKLAILTDPDFYTESSNTFYYHADHLGSSSLISDSQGREYERMAFTPHGEVWQQDSLDSLERIDLLFTGKSLDAETGWYYFGARYLDPKSGLWLSGDPALGEYIPRAPLTPADKEANGNLPGLGGVFNPLNLTLYHYAGNNPLKYVDPNGRESADAAYSRKHQIESQRVSQNELRPEKPSGPCLFRSLQAAAEEKVGKNLTLMQIKSSGEKLHKNGSIGSKTEYYEVINPTAVVKEALIILGFPDATVIIGNTGSSTGTADFTIRFIASKGHFQLGDAFGGLLWEPYTYNNPANAFTGKATSLRDVSILLEGN